MRAENAVLPVRVLLTPALLTVLGAGLSGVPSSLHSAPSEVLRGLCALHIEKCALFRSTWAPIGILVGFIWSVLPCMHLSVCNSFI